MKYDHSLFIYHKGVDMTYILLYVDDIIIIMSSTLFITPLFHSLLMNLLWKIWVL